MSLRQRTLAFALVFAFALACGCTASGASSGNFELVPERVGWYIGETAQFTLNITPSLTRQSPGYTVDRDFAIEEIQYEERGAHLGGDFETRDTDELHLVILQHGAAVDEATLDADHPTLTLQLDVPEKLRDSEYVLAIKLFKVGWVKSDPFRIDERSV